MSTSTIIPKMHEKRVAISAERVVNRTITYIIFLFIYGKYRVRSENCTFSVVS